MEGCDISYAQGSVNFDQLKSAVDFVIIRAGYTGAVDTQFKRNQAEARRVGLKIGYYWFTYPSNATTDADQFVSTVGTLQSGEFLVLDYEVSEGGVSYCKAFLDRVKSKTGITPFLYTNQNHTVTLDWSSVKGTYPLWVAIYDNNSTATVNTNGWKYIIKQYTADGSLPGIAGAVDLDYASSDPTKYGKGASVADIFTPDQVNTLMAIAYNRQSTASDRSIYTKNDVNHTLADVYAKNKSFRAKASQYDAVKAALDAANKKLASVQQEPVQIDQATKDQIAQTASNTNWLVSTFKKIFNIGD